MSVSLLTGHAGVNEPASNTDGDAIIDDAITQYITAVDLSLTFTTYDELKDYIKNVSRNGNFKPRITSYGKIESTNHHGVFLWWCHKEPPNTAQPAAIPNQHNSRRGVALKISNHGATRCSCQWTVYFAYSTTKQPHFYYFTGRGKTAHTNHNPATEPDHYTAINSLSEVPRNVRASEET